MELNMWTLASGAVFLLLALLDWMGSKALIKKECRDHLALRRYQKRQGLMEAVVGLCGVGYSVLEPMAEKPPLGLGVIAAVGVILILLNNRAFLKEVQEEE